MPPQTRIRPRDIDVSRQFINTFGKYQKEEVARQLVRMAQRRRGWMDFRLKDIPAGRNFDTFAFQSLMQDRLILDRGRDTYGFTTAFVERCYRTSPVLRTAPPSSSPTDEDDEVDDDGLAPTFGDDDSDDGDDD